ncbi:MAG: CBS domain-containing protein [Nitrospina sp.]|jgi:CBS domain-containing protein|nr:CBS domain-containing protein [Nitrospina sp.]MBT5633480.1 CBS domain-containing protein [Nitrospina sp.]
MPDNLIKTYMNSPVLSVDAEKTIQEAGEFMLKNEVRSLLVKDQSEYVGIVTKTDFILRVYINETMDPEKDVVLEIMSKPILSVDLDSTMEEARKYMQKNKIGHIGVTENGKIIGILSKENLLTYFGKLT